MSHQKPTSPSDDEAQDAWLKGALLHAPDAHADAPPALTHNILRESRLAAEGDAALRVKPLPLSGRTRWYMAAWNHLTRPAVAAGFASVMVATLAVVLWWDKPLDEKGDPPMAARAPEVVAAAPTAPDPTPAPAPAAPTTPAAVDTPRAATSEVQSTPSRRSARDVVADKEALAGSLQSTAKRADEPPPRAKQAKPPPLEEIKREGERDSAKAEVSTAAPPAAAPPIAAVAAAPSPSPSPSPTPESSAPTQREGNAAFAKAAQDRSTSLQSASRVAPFPPPANSALITPLVAPLAASPLIPLLSALANSPEQWRWQANGGEPQAISPALQSWLQLLERSTGSRWATLGPSVRMDDANSTAKLELRITSTGTGNSARIVLAGHTVTLQREGVPLMAVLTPAETDALRQAWAYTLR